MSRSRIEDPNAPAEGASGRRRWLIPAILTLVVALAGVGSYGRWATVHTFRSHPFDSPTEGVSSGRTSGTETPLTLPGGTMRLTWELGEGIDRFGFAFIPVDAPENFTYPDHRLGADAVGGLELTTHRRSGTRAVDLSAGSYTPEYWWDWKGDEGEEWTVRLEQRLPWWRSP